MIVVYFHDYEDDGSEYWIRMVSNVEPYISLFVNCNECSWFVPGTITQ